MTSSHPEREESILPFTHGIEVELQVIKKDGSWIRGEEVLSIFDAIVSTAKSLLDRKIRETNVESVQQKYSHSTQTEEGERGSRIVASYLDPKGILREYTLLGHDPNVTSLTWILEVATPPCTTLEELAWWLQTLVAIAYDSIPKDARIHLISTGLNPTQEYLKNLSFGEHHHILSPDVSEELKQAVYNLIRNFLPHLIALSVNSPFENKRPTDAITIDSKNRTRAPRCKRSIRLLKNLTQLGPISEFELIPYLVSSDQEAFARHVNRSYAKMVDIYPFTDYGTIEVRVFDTQLSVPRRVGIAQLLQALALKAKRMLDNGERIPDVGSKSLAANRASAVAAGLWGAFYLAESEEDGEFYTIYNNVIREDGTVDELHSNRFLGDAVGSMLYFIRDELEELDVIDNPFMQPLLVSVFGSDTVEPRTTTADYQLDVYAKSGMNLVVLLRDLAEVTRECSTNWLYDPLVGVPRLPAWMCWWKGFQIDITPRVERVFGGQDASFVISLRNALGWSISGLVVRYRVEDSRRRLVTEDIVSVPEMANEATHVVDVGFTTEKDASAYNLIATVCLGKKELTFSRTINTFWMNMAIRPTTSTQFADGRTPVLFTGELETNYPERTQIDCLVEVVAPRLETVFARVSKSYVVSKDDVILLNNEELPALMIPDDASIGVERCILRVSAVDGRKEEIAVATSKPFYVGFTQIGPQVLLRTDAKDKHAPGEVVHGEVGLRGKGNTIPKDARLVIEFVTDAETRYAIINLIASELLADSVRFEWRVPFASSKEPEENVGRIRATIVDGTTEIARAESEVFTITGLGVSMSIDSLRAPRRAQIGGEISGWLRVRRNTELGEPAKLTLKFEYPNGEEFAGSEQMVKQSRNLSIAYGPIVVPKPKALDNPRKVKLTATVFYAGIRLHSRSTEIDLMPSAGDEIVAISFSGLSPFVLPDESVRGAVHVTNTTGQVQRCTLLVGFESMVGVSEIIAMPVIFDADESKIFPMQFRIPLSIEMSTAHVIASVTCGDVTAEQRHRLKVKAIESPLFHAEFSLRDHGGQEILELVPRATPVWITVQLHTTRELNEGLELLLRVLSHRQTVAEFSIPYDMLDDERGSATVKWVTPSVDSVTGYHLDLVVMESGRMLPNRAVDVQEKQFTVY